MTLKLFARFLFAAGCGCALLLLISCAGDSNPSITDDSLDSGDTTPTQSQKTIGPEGGSLVSADGNFRLDFPPGAVGEARAFTITKRPVSDLPVAVTNNSQVTTLYMLEPEGIAFSAPVIATMTISSGGAVSDDVINIPERFLALESQNVISIPRSQHAVLDANTQILTLSGELSHFTRIWDNLPVAGGVSVQFSGIPVQVGAGAGGFTSNVSVAHPAASGVSVLQTTLVDSSVAPVQALGGGSATLGALSSGADVTLTNAQPYACTAAGEGTFVATVLFDSFDVSALVAPFDLMPHAGESQVIAYSAGVNRRILCGGSSSGTGNSGTSAVSISVDPSTLDFEHSVGVTACPQKVGTVKVENTGSDSVEVTADVSTAALSVSPETFELAANESKEVSVFFTCNQSASFDGTVTFTGTGEEKSESEDVAVSGDVHQ